MSARKILGVFIVLFLISLSCINSDKPDRKFVDTIPTVDSPQVDEKPAGGPVEYTAGSPTVYSGMEAEKERYRQVKNLLVFHTKDTMKLDSTYNATLALSKNISLQELTEKIEKIVEPGGKIKVTDTTQEIGLRMSATLEDKASEKDPNFSIKLVGSGSNIRTYDPKKNKMIWQWNVTPLKEGYHELGLSVAMIDSDGIAASPETQWYFITIYSERKKEVFGSKIGAFIGKNWQWMVSAIIIPLFIAWFTTRQRRLNEKTGQRTRGKIWRRRKP